jgi:hypothetical protein
MRRKKVKILIISICALLALISAYIFDTNYFQQIIHPEEYWTQRLELMRKSAEYDEAQIKMLSIELSEAAISENQNKSRNANIRDKIKFWEGMLSENKRELEKAKSELIRISKRKDKP